MDLDALLVERKKTHGEYRDHASMSQTLKQFMREGVRYADLNYHERETLDMIAHKIGRILSGDPHLPDHWDDIAGYARLSGDRNRPAFETKQKAMALPVAPPWPTDVAPPATATSSVDKAPELFDNLYSDAKNAGAAVATSTMAAVNKYKRGEELTDAERALYALWAETNEPSVLEEAKV